MARFIVAPKAGNGARFTLYEVIDTEPKGATEQERADRCRIGAFFDPLFAEGLAATLSGAGSVLDLEVEKARTKEPF